MLKKLLITLLVIFVLSCQAMAELTELPEPAGNIAIVTHNDMIYFIGGNDENIAKKSFYAYSLKTEKWEKLPDMNEGRLGHCALYYKDSIYVFGGIGNVKDSPVILSSVEVFDINKGVWRKEKDMPQKKGRFAMASKGNKVYFFGGLKDKTKSTDSVEEFDLETGTWEGKEDLPGAMNRMSAVTSQDGFIYVIGGENEDGDTLNSVYKYDPSTDKYTEISPLKDPRKNFGAISVDNRIIVTGGWDIKSGQKIFLKSTEIYNPYKSAWEEGPSLKEGRDATRIIILNGEFVAFGGYNGSVLSSIESQRLPFFSSSWRIDEPLKFHLAYLPSKESTGENAETVKSLGYTEDYRPDIDNIIYRNIYNLGFPLPEVEDGEKYKLYLKLFEFPSCFNVTESTIPLLDEYLMNKLGHSEILYKFVSSAHNVAVKMEYKEKSDKEFSPSSPYPSFKVSKDGQKAFDEDVNFMSLYVTPFEKKEGLSQDEQENWSAQGVVAFHRELVRIYRKDLKEISGIDGDNYYYFLQKADNKSSVIIKVPRNPMVFSDWRHNDMPADPGHMFLSGLLLIYRTEYKNQDTCNIEKMIVDSEDFFKHFSKEKATVFEVGSVVRI